jgi:hypothetical protein
VAARRIAVGRFIIPRRRIEPGGQQTAIGQRSVLSIRIGRLAASRSRDWFERHAIVGVPASYPGKGRRVYPGSAQRTALLPYSTSPPVGRR